MIANEATRPLILWTIYDSPSDHPGVFVARMFHIWPAGPEATAEVVISPSLDEVRRAMMLLGLTPLTRAEGDDPVIVEIWI